MLYCGDHFLDHGKIIRTDFPDKVEKDFAHLFRIGAGAVFTVT